MGNHGNTYQLKEEIAEKIRTSLYLPLIEHEEVLRQRTNEEKDSRDRAEYQRDYTRILYSSAFRRLQGKMQLMPMNGMNFIRNRLTHSLEVAQIARSIAIDIGYKVNELYVVEAASLAHDIGNPPFGHYGEKVLNNIIQNKCDYLKCCMEEIEGFEGNAQTLRVLTKLSGKSNQYEGLNLTNRVLLGVTKYFNTFSEDKNKFIYKSDYEVLSKLVSEYQLPKRTLDVQIMDLSDEIAYAAHDIEDTLKNRKFTIEEFVQEFRNNKNLEHDFSESEISNACDFIENDIINEAKSRIEGNAVQYNDLFAKEIGSLIIYNLIRNIDVVESESGEKTLDFTRKFKVIAGGLKKITFECINRENEVRYYEHGGEIILKELFDYFFKNHKFLPREYCDQIKDENDDKQKIRPVIDYISGMMDGYAISMHKEIYGENRFKVYGFVGVNNENK